MLRYENTGAVKKMIYISILNIKIFVIPVKLV